MRPVEAEISRRHGRGKTIVKRLTPDGLGVRTSIEYHRSSCPQEAVAEATHSFAQAQHSASDIHTAGFGFLGNSSRLLNNLSTDDNLLQRPSPTQVRVVRSAPSSVRASPVVHLPGGRSLVGFEEAQHKMLLRSHSGFKGTPGKTQQPSLFQSFAVPSAGAALPHGASAQHNARPSPGLVAGRNGSPQQMPRFAPGHTSIQTRTIDSPGFLVHTQSCERHARHPQAAASQTGSRSSTGVGTIAKELAFTPQAAQAAPRDMCPKQYYRDDDGASIASSAVASTASSGRFAAAVASTLQREDHAAQHRQNRPAAAPSPSHNIQAKSTGHIPSNDWRQAPQAAVFKLQAASALRQVALHPQLQRPPNSPAPKHHHYKATDAHSGAFTGAEEAPIQADREGTSGEPRSPSSMRGRGSPQHSSMGGRGSPESVPVKVTRKADALEYSSATSLAQALSAGLVTNRSVVAAAAGHAAR